MLDIYIKRTISTILIVTIAVFMTFGTNAYAHTDQITTEKLDDVDINEVSSNQIQIIDGDTVGTITVLEDNPNFRKVLIESSDEEDIILTTDKQAQTITSSKTGKIININAENIILASSPKVGDTKTVKISYKQIKDAVGTGSAIIGIAGFIASFFTGAGALLVASIATKLGGIGGLISLVSKGSPNHGIKIVSQYYMRRTTKNGKVYRYGDWKLKSISTY